MQDVYYLANLGPNGGLFAGVYDGHGDFGLAAAVHAKENLHRIFQEERGRGKSHKEAFLLAYQEISKFLESNFLLEHSGTTAAGLYLEDGIVYFANAGDTRIIVVSKNGVKQLTTDHRLSSQEERERIIKFGGSIDGWYVRKAGSGLMPTRSLGDGFFKDVGVIAVPNVGKYEIDANDEWLIVATDGLFDIMENNELARCTIGCSETAEVAANIREMAINSPDNVTFILVKLNTSFVNKPQVR